MIRPLTCIFKQCLITGIFPDNVGVIAVSPRLYVLCVTWHSCFGAGKYVFPAEEHWAQKSQDVPTIRIIGRRDYSAMNVFIARTGIYIDIVAFAIVNNNLKLAKVIPLHKKDDKIIMINYRPFSLLPSIFKIYEKAAHNQIYKSHYFISHNLFYEHQYGFRSKHSME